MGSADNLTKVAFLAIWRISTINSSAENFVLDERVISSLSNDDIIVRLRSLVLEIFQFENGQKVVLDIVKKRLSPKIIIKKKFRIKLIFLYHWKDQVICQILSGQILPRPPGSGISLPQS